MAKSLSDGGEHFQCVYCNESRCGDKRSEIETKFFIFENTLEISEQKPIITVEIHTEEQHKYSSYYRTGAFREPFTSMSSATSIMICGFDNMEARKVFFNSWKNYVELKPDSEQKHCLFIDGRLAAEEFQVFCIRGDDKYNINRYANEFLFSDSEADETICSYKQTSFMANMIGSIIINLFVNFCANDLKDEEKPLLERDLPFLTTYDASSMMFITNH